MRYKNKVTGAVFDSPFNISGGDWILLGSTKADEQKTVHVEVTNEEPTPVTTVEEMEENTVDFDGVTRKEIMQELDAMGVKYDPRAKKQELYDLMMSQGE
ncbi:hypothetical protein [Enterococcus avium]|uniref:hypothetical protein n=1 Tax=Enterococcus avium TaxID=33945 RepID=UPI002E12162A